MGILLVFHIFQVILVMLLANFSVLESAALRNSILHPQFGRGNWTLGIAWFWLGCPDSVAATRIIGRHSHSCPITNFPLHSTLPFHGSWKISYRLITALSKRVRLFFPLCSFEVVNIAVALMSCKEIQSILFPLNIRRSF